MSSDAVKVVVRIRPLVESEKNRGCQSIVRKTPLQQQVVVNSGTKITDLFTFNYVFAPEDTQEMLYENAVKTMVSQLFEGYNVTIFAYGQTGSGKTHTMGTTFDGNVNDDIGVIPRAVNDIFSHIEEESDHEFSVNCSFVELYQERLYDLLSPNAREQSVVDIREVDTKIVIPNLTEVTVNDSMATTNCLIRGSADRAVGTTAMNAQSSRSHAIFTITIQKMPKNNPSAATIAKFTLVDLAGSERSKKTLTVGEQFKEGVKINQGLLALGNVISALGADRGHNNGHVSYRDSKLTRLLQDSLGGNSMTLMIACVSPADYNMEETLGTLRYADRAKKIKNKPIVNEDPKTAEINRLKTELQALRVELSSKDVVGNGVMQKCDVCYNPPTKAQLQKQLREMVEKMQLNLCEMAHRENVITEYEDTIDSLRQKISDLKAQIEQMDKLITADMSPDDLQTYKDNVRVLTDTILNINEHMNERTECILQSSKASETPILNGSRLSLADQEEEFVENNEKYIRKQTDYQQELREIKNELDVKEKLHQKLFSNYKKFCSMNDELNEATKIQNHESEIAKLEKERDELKDVLRNKNTTVSAKLAEERRQRVQQLESEIAEMKKKNKQQAQLLKQREKDGEQIKKLNTEIQEMKQLKVRLIRKMKSESDEFRLWRAAREKELLQLRVKGRKLETEAAKKELLYEKQRNVLKRKVEEAAAANKRLKDALMKQQQSKASKVVGKGPLNKSTSWLCEEIEVITSIVDIKQSYEQLIEVRADLTAQLTKLKRQKPLDTEKINSLQAEIDMHSAQITDLNGKINTHDLDAKSKAIYDNVQNLPEGRAIIKHLLNNIIEGRTNFNNYFAQARDAKHMLETCEEQKLLLENELKQKSDEMLQTRNQLERENEEKTELLLKALSSKGSQSELVQMLQLKLSEKDEEIEHLKKQPKEFPLDGKRKRRNLRLHEIIDESLDDSVVSQQDDPTLDPDWRETPMHKRVQKSISARSLSVTSNDSESKTEQPARPPSRTSNKRGCGCKTGCKRGMCGCRRQAAACTEFCQCKAECLNLYNSKNVEASKRGHTSDEDEVSIDTDDDKENNSGADDVHTPKKLRAA